MTTATRKRAATPEQKAKAAVRRERMRELAKRISAMPEADRLAMAERAGIFTIERRSLSPFNQCMVIMQNPAATVVGGFRQWINAGRAVRKGETGLSIWVPIGQEQVPEGVTLDDGASGTPGKGPRFVLGTVFDISQTDEAAQPAGEA